MQSVYSEIKRIVESSENGTLFFPDDFAALGSSDAIRAALVRLCRSGVIMRAAQGIYYHPKTDTKWGSGIIPPTIEEIAEGIAKRDKVRIVPSLTTGLRGLAYWEIEVTGPNRDLHSGHFGGAVANPINVLCKLMADITDADGRITIPGFYDDVEDVSPAEREMIAQIPFDEAKYKAAIGVDELFGEKGYSTLERNSCRPSFDICGIWGGYMEEGSKTVLPSKAYAKVSCRLVPHQDHEKISKLFEEYIARVAPAYVKVRVTPKHGGQGYVCPIDLPAYKAAEEAVAVAFGKRPLAVRRGGSIPIISTFEQVLGIKTVLMGFGLEQNAIHSPNESCTLDFFYKGIESVAEFYKRFN